MTKLQMSQLESLYSNNIVRLICPKLIYPVLSIQFELFGK